MRQVRVGGHYLEGREQRLWAALAGLVVLAGTGIALVVSDPGSGLFHPTLLHLGGGLAAVATAFRLGRPVTRSLWSVRTGRRGERKGTDLLGGHSDTYWLVIYLTQRLAHMKWDYLLISPPSLLPCANPTVRSLPTPCSML